MFTINLYMFQYLVIFVKENYFQNIPDLRKIYLQMF